MSLSILERLAGNPRLFRGTKILVIGDIALDRSFLCTSARPGFHAVHAGESIFDVQPGGDDFGTIGSAFNCCLLCRALGADAPLVTVTGDDPEGARVAGILAGQGMPARQIRLPGVQTITRFRVYVRGEETAPLRLAFRVDKDPDYARSSLLAAAQVRSAPFLAWFTQELQSTDAVLFNDTDKGFLSAGVLEVLTERIRAEASSRAAGGRERLVVVVDPKREWKKYALLAPEVLKPNLVDACKAAGLPELDIERDENLLLLARDLAADYGKHFPTMVITLGSHGAALVRCTSGDVSVRRMPVIPVERPQGGMAMHCGDMFASALALGLAIGEEISSAAAFANCVASLQFAKPFGEKVGLEDLIDPEKQAHLRKAYRPWHVVSAP